MLLRPNSLLSLWRLFAPVASLAIFPTVYAELVLVVHLELALVGDTSTIDTDEALTRERVIHNISVQILSNFACCLVILLAAQIEE